jgi:hypothetical protein
MREGEGNRHREYFQTFRSEIKTLALCDSLKLNTDDNGATFIKVRIRTVKADRRLPLVLTIAYEPEGGSPDNCILAHQIPNPSNPLLAGPGGFLPDLLPGITVAECILLNRSYVPIVRTIGNLGPTGTYPLCQRPGQLGLSIVSEGDCDAVDLIAILVSALGDRKNPAYVLHPSHPGAQDQNPLGQRYGGRWLFQYSMTCTDRLSREEWDTAVLATNAQVEIVDTDAPDFFHIVTLHGTFT